ncbi:TolC family outer membrane protein [Rudaea cellulosilytica]|uniref:TolC family outer membrane protein n=1 Tax=Rudaea cellulosilytica TaxID=540746 RepID=UPI00035D0609|nr:TolC family outer membrane protein [Rudaea cellulosilytica]
MQKNKLVHNAARDRIKLGVLAAALAVAVLSSPLRAEDLTQIYTQAREADPTLAAADANRLATKEGSPQARAALLPQINGSYGYSRSDTGGNSTAPELVTQNDGSSQYEVLSSGSYLRNRSRPAAVQLNQVLFNWADITRLRGANALSEGADFTYDAASQDLLVRTATAYFNVLTAEDQLTFSQANEKSLQKQLDQADERFKVGLSAITDVHVARAQHDSAVAGVIVAQNNVETQREALVQIIGKSFGDLKKLRDPVPLDKPVPAEMQAWVDLASKQNPSLASAQKSVDSAEYGIQTARSGHYPTLNATLQRQVTPGWGNSTYFGPNGASEGPLHGNSVTGNTAIGVTLSIPIFSGGLISSQTRQAVYQRDAAQDQLEITRRGVLANTRNAYRTVISGISEVEAAKAAVVSAQSAVDATQAGFEVGTKTILDVLTSQSQLVSAQSSYSQARHNFVLSGLLLKQAAGSIAVKDLDAVNALLQ